VKRKKANPIASAAIRLNCDIGMFTARRHEVSKISEAYDTRNVEDVSKAIATLFFRVGCSPGFLNIINGKFIIFLRIANHLFKIAIPFLLFRVKAFETQLGKRLRDTSRPDM
jgi:hypothetical protein